MKSFILLWILFPLIFSQLLKPQYFDIQIDRFEVNYTDPEVLAVNFKIKKVNKVRSIVGTFDSFVQVDDNLLCGAKVLKKQGNEYKYQPYRIPQSGLCSALQNDG